MAKHKRIKTTIDINGKTYDAITGRHIGPAAGLAASSQSVDGFVASSPGTRISPTKPASGHSRLPTPELRQAGKTTSRTAAKHAKRNVAKSHTLMRNAVDKPSTTHTAESALQKDLIKRSQRAKQIQKSRLVRHFNPDAAAKSAATVPIKQQDQPVAKPAGQNHTQTQHPPATPPHTASRSAAGRPKRPSIQDFEKAVQNATSHLEKLPAKQRKRRLRKPSKSSVALASVAALLLIGFFGWQNAPNLQMRLAASRADIPATLPGYNPDGYSIDGGIRSEDGKVTVSFRSEDGKSYSITEQASNWDDNALYANYVEPRQGQTYPGNDKKIYLVDGSDATWVANGIWYRVGGTADLSTDQLGRIANSL